MHYETETIQALEDLSTHQYQAIALDDGKVANNGAEAIGILLNKPEINQHATVVPFGRSKFRAGGAIAAAKAITVATSGYFTAAGSGDYIVGRNETAVTTGSIGSGFFNFLNPIYAMSSSYAW